MITYHVLSFPNIFSISFVYFSCSWTICLSQLSLSNIQCMYIILLTLSVPPNDNKKIEVTSSYFYAVNLPILAFISSESYNCLVIPIFIYNWPWFSNNSLIGTSTIVLSNTEDKLLMSIFLRTTIRSISTSKPTMTSLSFL